MRFNIHVRSRNEPGKLDIKRRELSVYPWLQSSNQDCMYDVIIDFCVDSVSLVTSFKKWNTIMT